MHCSTSGVCSIKGLMDTSPNCIIPQKAQVAIAQTQASKVTDRFSDTFKAWSMGMVMGGHTGQVCDPNTFCRPHNDQSMHLWASFDSGLGQPWAIFQA